MRPEIALWGFLLTACSLSVVDVVHSG